MGIKAMYAFKENGEWVFWTGQLRPLDGGSELYHVPSYWPDEDKRTRFGVYPVIKDEVPEGHRVVSQELVDDNGTPRLQYVTEEIPIEEIRANMPPLTARQFRLGLIGGGISVAQVKAAIDAIEDEQARAVAQVEWEYATQFLRNHPLVEQLAPVLGLTPEQVDTMWQGALGL